MKSLVHTEELCSRSVPLEYAPGAKPLVCVGLKSGIVPREGHLRTVLKPLGGVTGVFLSPVLIPHSSQPLPKQFSCLSQNTLWKDQESPQNEIRD